MSTKKSSSGHGRVPQAVTIRWDWIKDTWCVIDPSTGQIQKNFDRGILTSVGFDSSSAYDSSGCGRVVGVATGFLAVHGAAPKSGRRESVKYDTWASKFKDSNDKPVAKAAALILRKDRSNAEMIR